MSRIAIKDAASPCLTSACMQVRTAKKIQTGIALLAAGAFLFSASAAQATNNDPTPNPIAGEVFASQPSSERYGDALLELRPQSNHEELTDIGQLAHTHLRMLVPSADKKVMPISQAQAMDNIRNLGHGTPDNGASFGDIVNTPASIACLYQLVPQPTQQPAGCNPAMTTLNPTGGGGAIAIVDAYDDPTAASDFAYFSQFFGIPSGSFKVIYAGGYAPYISGPKPPSGVSSGWNVEEALDIEWAHAMAPSAKIYLVEAQNSSISALLTAVIAAQYLVAQSGGGEISMSWGSSEFSSETSYDYYFSPAVSPQDVIYVASSGDVGSVVSWPSVSPYVISAGGTSINRSSNGSFVSETAWSNSGGGVSCCEPRPAFQSRSSVESLVNTHRGVPDISFDANPSSGVAVYVSGQWWLVGGTSVSAPSLAGILNVAHYATNRFLPPEAELSTLYTDGSYSYDFRDASSGSCGAHSAKSGYDLCTGWGSPLTYAGK